MAEAGLTERLQGRAERAGLLLAPALAARLAAYVALLLRWNEHMNLTALGGDDQGLDRLVVEPLLAARRIPRGCGGAGGHRLGRRIAGDSDPNGDAEDCS